MANKVTDVTPCMGVWIETPRRYEVRSLQQSHPVWVCGLKLMLDLLLPSDGMSHPVWVCGLKHRHCTAEHTSIKSHPVWVCGLNPKTYNDV